MAEDTTIRCRKCGYDLRGLEDPVCPECGHSEGVSLFVRSPELSFETTGTRPLTDDEIEQIREPLGSSWRRHAWEQSRIPSRACVVFLLLCVGAGCAGLAYWRLNVGILYVIGGMSLFGAISVAWATTQDFRNTRQFCRRWHEGAPAELARGEADQMLLRATHAYRYIRRVPKRHLTLNAETLVMLWILLIAGAAATAWAFVIRNRATASAT
ncbi:MAG: hypothetical protein ACF8LL_05190 [Phycisphaerales bacterium]